MRIKMSDEIKIKSCDLIELLQKNDHVPRKHFIAHMEEIEKILRVFDQKIKELNKAIISKGEETCR